MILKNKLLDIFYLANQRFLKKNIESINNNINERNMCALLSNEVNRIIENTELKDYYCDVEYNRNGKDVKTIIDDECVISRIEPDLIIHSRGQKQKDNLLVMEMKKEYAKKEDKDSDRKRLKLMTKQQYSEVFAFGDLELPRHVCMYEVGIFYIIDIRKNLITLEIYSDSKLINIETNTFEYFMNYRDDTN